MADTTEEDPTKKLYWHLIEYSTERTHVLIQLRYQLAFVIIVIITGIWTILGTANPQVVNNITQNNYLPILTPTNQNLEIASFFSIGWVLTVLVIGIWRFFTHIVCKEEHIIWVSWESYLNQLGIMESRYCGIEKALKLDKNEYYEAELNKLDSKQQNELRLVVMKELMGHIRDTGILLFDKFSIIAIAIGSYFIYITMNNFNFTIFM